MHAQRFSCKAMIIVLNLVDTEFDKYKLIVSLTRDRSVFFEGPKWIDEGQKFIFQKGPKGRSGKPEW